MNIPEIVCTGTPYEIGHTHGSKARDAIVKSIRFYESFFQETTRRSWDQILETARQFDSNIRQKWPDYYEEIKGVAEGSGRDILDIIALNTRTEIAFGLMDEGCTSLYTQNDAGALMGQNWDWQPEQKSQLVHLVIAPLDPAKATMKFITEAGLIGKIGLNSYGTGVLFNAITAPGISPSKLPAHLALRMALESRSAQAAVDAISEAGVASACYIMVGDSKEAIGIECTPNTIRLQRMNGKGRVWHTNHLILDHGPDVKKWSLWPDSTDRFTRIEKLANDGISLSNSLGSFKDLFLDEQNFPVSICRMKSPPMTNAETLFNIVMDLEKHKAEVVIGRPNHSEGKLTLQF